MKIKGKQIEFTKILTVIISLIYYGFYIFSIIYWYKENRYMSAMIEYIYKPFAIIVSCYTLKSGLQNNDKIKKNYSKENKKPLSFSKILMLFIILSFFISVFYFCIAWVIIDRFPADLFNYISSPFLAILPSYMVKTVVENRALNNMEYAGVVDAIVNTKDIGGGISEDIITFLNDLIHGREHDTLSRSTVEEVVGDGSGVGEITEDSSDEDNNEIEMEDENTVTSSEYIPDEDSITEEDSSEEEIEEVSEDIIPSEEEQEDEEIMESNDECEG